MPKEFVLKTTRGKPDSLKRAVKVAFTITPTDLGDPTCPWNPVANWATSFSVDGEQRVSIQWPESMSYYVANCELIGSGFSLLDSTLIESGQSATLDSTAHWTSPTIGNEQDKVILSNKSGSERSLVIYLYGPNVYLISLPFFDNKSSIKIPSSWRLQAYVVNEEIKGQHIVQAEDLRDPILQVPIDLHSLPNSSSWTLCQAPDGKFRLKNDQYPELGYSPKEKPSEKVEEKNQLSLILERLTLIEKSIGNIQEDVRSGQQAMLDIRNQLSSVEKAASIMREDMVAVQESQIAAASTFDRSQSHLAALQEAVTATQQQLSGMDKSTKDRLQGLNDKVIVVGSKANETAGSLTLCDHRLSALEEVGNSTKDHVVAVEKAVNRTQDHVHLVQQLVVATNSQLSMMDRRSGHTALEAEVPGQGQGTNTAQRAGGSEGQAGSLEKSLSQVQEQLSTVKKVVRTIDRRMPSMEGRADELENSLGQTRVDLAAVQVSLTSLNRRVSALEARPAGDTERAGWSSSEGSPVTFPSQLTPDTLPP